MEFCKSTIISENQVENSLYKYQWRTPIFTTVIILNWKEGTSKQNINCNVQQNLNYHAKLKQIEREGTKYAVNNSHHTLNERGGEYTIQLVQ